MNTEHIQVEAVKSYVLGTLPDDEASAFEERYFMNPAFLDEIRRMEIDLVCEFLDGELTKTEQEQFKRRCLEVPRLKRLVDKVRDRRQANIPPQRSMAWIISATAALVCISVISFLALRKGHAPTIQNASVKAPLQGATLFLEPGITMGPASETKKLVLSSKVEPVSLVVEVPGETASADYVARLFSIGSDGSRKNTFSSSPIRSIPRNGGQQVTVQLSSSALPSGDYLLELQPVGAPAKETYAFRVKTPDE